MRRRPDRRRGRCHRVGALQDEPGGPARSSIGAVPSHAVDISTGAMRWTHACTAESGLGSLASFLAVADGVVAAGTNAVVTALEAETGEVR
jgi:hypothetical protein